jgi:hypothetical protein
MGRGLMSFSDEDGRPLKFQSSVTCVTRRPVDHSSNADQVKRTEVRFPRSWDKNDDRIFTGGRKQQAKTLS